MTYDFSFKKIRLGSFSFGCHSILYKFQVPFHVGWITGASVIMGQFQHLRRNQVGGWNISSQHPCLISWATFKILMTFHYTDWFRGIIQQTTRIWLLLSLCLVFSWLFSLVFQPMSSTHVLKDDFPPPMIPNVFLQTLLSFSWGVQKLAGKKNWNNRFKQRKPGIATKEDWSFCGFIGGVADGTHGPNKGTTVPQGRLEYPTGMIPSVSVWLWLITYI